MEQISEVELVVGNLGEIQEDTTVPRNVRLQIQNVMNSLRADTEISIKISKALNQLDEVSSDVNLQSYTRTQIWNAMSALEKLH